MNETGAALSPISLPLPEVAEAAGLVDKRELAQKLVEGVVRLMGLSGTAEVQDAADGGISIALFLAEEIPGLQEGKRSHLLESLQFLMNKMVNRQPQGRRWIALGVGGHPPPRSAPTPKSATEGEGAPLRVPAPSARPALRPTARPEGSNITAPPAAHANVGDEARLEVSVDPRLEELALNLAEKSARLGRLYAIRPMLPEDRARMLQAARQVPGVSLKMEGEARNRRLIFIPQNPIPMPQKQFPLDDDEFEDEEASPQ